MNKLNFKTLILILTLAVLSTGFFGLAGKGTISGTVTDINGTAVSGATVSTNKTDSSDTTMYSATTGTDGTYILENIPSGTYTITATKGIFTGSLADVTLENPSFFSCATTALSDKNIQFDTAQKILIDEDFESYPTGPFVNGMGEWTFYTETDTNTCHIDATIAALDTNKSLVIDKWVLCFKYFDNYSSKNLEFEAYVKYNSTSTKTFVGIHGFSDLGDDGILINSVDGKLIVVYSHDVVSKDTNIIFAINTWYKINISIDVQQAKWIVKINDSNEISDFIGNNFISVACIIGKDYIINDCKAYFDEIKVTCNVSDANKAFRTNFSRNTKNAFPGKMLDFCNFIFKQIP